MNIFRTLAVTALLAVPAATFAQKGVEDGSKYGHGEDSVTCVMNLVQYGDQVKMKNFKDAYEPWKVVFAQCPLAKGTGLYTDGLKIMKALIKTDKANKDTYYNFILSIYDQRAKYFGNNKKYPTSYLMGMKALDIVAFGNDSKETRAEVIALLETALAGSPATIQPAFLQTYMSQVASQYSNDETTAENVVNAYVKCCDIMPQVETAGGDKIKEAVATSKDNIEQTFAHSGAADCATLEKIFAPQLATNKANEAWLKRINKLLGNGDCTDSDLFYATSEELHKIAPEASSARGLAKMYLKQNDIEKCLSYYEEAIKLEEDANLKGKYYYEMAFVLFSNNNLSAAKSAALNAAQNRADWGAPYILLAKLYATGARNIGEKDYEKKAGYWAAVDKLVKAKSIDASEAIQKEATDLIRQYSQYFPSKEDLFFEGIKDGSSFHVGGFINENTTVRAKK
ncbi:MAG: hypothetical protein II375_00150 [Bacteroidales bacterium]|nr:hypothetical protein [Bacteroidales bacterium]